MRKVTFWLLWLFVFTVPWEPWVTITGIGTITRAVGILATAIGVVTILIQGHFRRLSLVFYAASAFVVSALLSLLWTLGPEHSIEQVRTYMQLLGVLWLVWEFARHADQQRSLIEAYCLGAYVSIADGFYNFASGMSAVGGLAQGRYAGSNFDPNDFGLMLAIGIPMSWFLFLTGKGGRRLAAAAYLALAPVAILLTASRAATFAGIVALSIIPLTLVAGSVWSTVGTMFLGLIAAGTAVVLVPEATWVRIGSAGSEIAQGSVGGRSLLWVTGLRVFQDHPIIGVGSGAFRAAVQPILGNETNVAHNVLIAILVEQGLVGVVVFMALLAICARLTYGLDRIDRAVWTIIGLTWLTGTFALDWQYSKVTWLLFGLLSTRAAVINTARSSRESAVFKRRPVAYSAASIH